MKHVYECRGIMTNKKDETINCYGVYETYSLKQATYLFLKEFKAYRRKRGGEVYHLMRDMDIRQRPSVQADPSPQINWFHILTC